MKNENGEKLMKAREAANYLNMSVMTLTRYRKEGKGPPYLRIEGSIRYDKNILNAYLREKGVTP